MTEQDLAAIIAGIAPVLRAHLDLATQRVDGLERAIITLRETVLPPLRAAETRTRELEQRLNEWRLELDAERAVRP